jgi:hypothetical protein
MADFYFLFGAYYATYYLCNTMANSKKITPAQSAEDIKIVRTYRIKPATFEAADKASKQKYGKGVAGIVEQLIENHFNLTPKKK